MQCHWQERCAPPSSRAHTLPSLRFRTLSRPAVGSCSREPWISACSPIIPSLGCGGWTFCSCCFSLFVASDECHPACVQSFHIRWVHLVSATNRSLKLLSPRISKRKEITCIILCGIFYKYMGLAFVCFCVESVTLHLGVSLDDGCQIGVIAYALNGLKNHCLRMSPCFRT